MVRTSRNKLSEEDSSLRPWTVNPKSDLLLVEEVVKLDKIISRTSPQKNAGYRGSSSLEKLPELAEFQATLRETLGRSLDRASKRMNTSNEASIEPTINNVNHENSERNYSGNYVLRYEIQIVGIQVNYLPL